MIELKEKFQCLLQNIKTSWEVLLRPIVQPIIHGFFLHKAWITNWFIQDYITMGETFYQNDFRLVINYHNSNKTTHQIG
jgi:hypothetical protein